MRYVKLRQIVQRYSENLLNEFGLWLVFVGLLLVFERGLLVDCQRTLVQLLGLSVATLFAELISIFVELYRISKALRRRHCPQYHNTAHHSRLDNGCCKEC